MRTCDTEPFLYPSTPQANLEEGASGGQINEQVIEGYLNRLREAVCEDLQAIEARLDAIEAGVFGEIWAEGNAVATAIPGAATFVQATVFTNNGESSVATPNHTQDHILIQQDGVYVAMVSASVLSGAGLGAIFEAEVRCNNGTVRFTNVHWDRQLAGGGGDVGSTSMSGLARLSVGDTVEVWVQNKANGTDITFEDINLTVIKVGD